MRHCFSVLKYSIPKFKANPEMLGLKEHLSFRFVNLLVKNTSTINRNAESVLDAIEVGDLYMNTEEIECRFIFRY